MKRTILISLLTAAVLTGMMAQEAAVIRTGAKSSKGWLGVGIQDVTPKFAREEGLKVKEGAFVNEVVEESPADSAGIEEEDVVTEFNGKRIETAEDLSDAVAATKPGTKVTVKVNRNGETKSLTAVIRKNKTRSFGAFSMPAMPKVVMERIGAPLTAEGLSLMELNQQLAEYFEVPNKKGVLVTSTEADENGAKAGIKAGDVLTKIGDEVVKGMDDVHEALSEAEEGDKLPVELFRKGKKMTVTLEVSEQHAPRHGRIYFRNGDQGHFNFELQQKELDRMHEGLEMRMKELPKRQRELIRLERKLSGAEV
ncbi:MAG: PDZ domain-containing protein [Bacteroidetes bacterium]|nr:PDZ domain-containing protein [Bacteroidota bacterium]